MVSSRSCHTSPIERPIPLNLPVSISLCLDTPRTLGDDFCPPRPPKRRCHMNIRNRFSAWAAVAVLASVQRKVGPMNVRFRFAVGFLAATLWAGVDLGNVQAGIYTFADFTRAAGGAPTTVTADFQPDEGWTGSPVNSTGTADTTPIYLTTTVSWNATASNIGTFNIRFNQNDDAGAARIGMGKTGGAGTGFEFITLNATGDPDGAGPATARPTIVGVDSSVVTSVTLVMKVDHSLAGTNPGGDWWFADAGLQDSAVGFMWINPDLGASEASQFTPWAAWRSGNAGYQGVSFISDTDAVELSFFQHRALHRGRYAVRSRARTSVVGVGCRRPAGARRCGRVPTAEIERDPASLLAAVIRPVILWD